MSRIAERAEHSINYVGRFARRDIDEAPNVTNAISHATCTTAHDLNAAAIITVTKSGTTARMISKYRPAVDIIGCTTDPEIQRQMNLSWGVTPLLIEEESNTDDLFEVAVEVSVREKLISDGRPCSNYGRRACRNVGDDKSSQGTRGGATLSSSTQRNLKACKKYVNEFGRTENVRPVLIILNF